MQEDTMPQPAIASSDHLDRIIDAIGKLRVDPALHKALGDHDADMALEIIADAGLQPVVSVAYGGQVAAAARDNPNVAATVRLIHPDGQWIEALYASHDSLSCVVAGALRGIIGRRLPARVAGGASTPPDKATAGGAATTVGAVGAAGKATTPAAPAAPAAAPAPAPAAAAPVPVPPTQQQTDALRASLKVDAKAIFRAIHASGKDKKTAEADVRKMIAEVAKVESIDAVTDHATLERIRVVFDGKAKKADDK